MYIQSGRQIVGSSCKNQSKDRLRKRTKEWRKTQHFNGQFELQEWKKKRCLWLQWIGFEPGIQAKATPILASFYLHCWTLDQIQGSNTCMPWSGFERRLNFMCEAYNSIQWWMSHIVVKLFYVCESLQQGLDVYSDALRTCVGNNKHVELDFGIRVIRMSRNWSAIFPFQLFVYYRIVNDLDNHENHPLNTNLQTQYANRDCLHSMAKLVLNEPLRRF